MNKIAKMFLAAFLAVMLCGGLVGMAQLSLSDTVTLDAPHTSKNVNFFYRVHGSHIDVDEITSMPDGMACTRLDGPMDVDPRDGGGSISYYKLDCDGTVGYVNERWVTRHYFFAAP